MIYAYDLLVNPNEDIYDFYDWSELDKFLHIRKIPLFKVDNQTFNDLVFKKIKIDTELLNIIKDKTQVFKLKKVENISFALVFANKFNAVFIKFDELGNEVEKSKFLVNEELEIVELASKLKNLKLNYTVMEDKICFSKNIREEKRKMNLIIEELEKIKNNEEKIDYLFYELYGEKSSINKYKCIIEAVKKGVAKNQEFVEILNLLSIQKNV